MKRQPPVYSPLSAGAITGAIFATVPGGEGERGALEQTLLERFSAESALLASSGTHALQVGLGLLPEVEPGERVVAMPAYSCYDLITAAVGAGARVRFYDVDPENLSVDPDSLRTAVNAGVSGIVAGNLYGYPLDWTVVRAVADEAGVPVIEDAAQGVGTSTPLGAGASLGDLTVLSFGRGKGWTGGGGGALLARAGRGPHGAELVERLRAQDLAESGRGGARTPLVTLAAWALGRPSLYWIPTAIPGLGLGETHYREPSHPRSILAVSAALARRTESASTRAIPGRRRVAAKLERGLSEAAGVRVALPVGGPERASFLRLPVLAPDRASAEDLRVRGAALGVQSGYPRPLQHLPASAPIDASGSPALPGATALAERLLTLPTHKWIGDHQIEALAALFRIGS